MFKLESYITPIILSYVNRYITNLKPEDSQVSLWGGDATFHNLELNLDVLEQELQLPFSFVSGSIRELSIHVPWTKIASEPITITINTIECILNLKGKCTRPTPNKKAKEKVGNQNKQVEAPPGYIQQLINKIVSNICIHCNNLILKYVEEDIVLSMNVKLLKFESADEKWEPTYTDLSATHVVLRKVISVNDLTLCLDKRNASGKIEVYQEPMLYRCSMAMHLLRTYNSATANRASTTRLDVFCNSMEFSMSEQQVPMFMRLLMLLYALHQKQLKPESDTIIDGVGSSADNKEENQEQGESWSGWAWSYVSSVLPAPWDDHEEDNASFGYRGHTLHFGFYVDRASITFKTSEPNSDRNYYAHKKIRYHPMLTLELQGIYSETVIHGLQWLNCTGGVSEAILKPLGCCSCGYMEVDDNPSPYLKMGCASNFHKIDSLFDADAIENNGGKRSYNTTWELHMDTTTESVLLEKTPAFAFDYLYKMDIPIDMTSELLSDLGSNYEFSNLSEVASLRMCIGPFRLRFCSGLLHRCGTLQVASSYYDYPPYYRLKPDLPLQDLPPASEEDFDALSEFIPTRSMRLTVFAPLVELEMMDHPLFKPTKGCMFKRAKKMNASYTTSTSSLPKLTIECQFIDMSQEFPMYVNRLVHTTCKLPEPPKNLFEACFVKKSVKVVGLMSRLVTNAACQSIMLTPCGLSLSTRTILKPQYWTDPNIPHDELIFESENLTLNGTKAKMLLVHDIIERMFIKKSEPGKNFYSSSLLNDACKDLGFPYMEIYIEGIRFKKVITNSTQAVDMSVSAVKAFIFELIDKSQKSNDLQQILFMSGPEVKQDMDTMASESPLLIVTIQFPLKPDLQKHPPIIMFNLQEIRVCIDPLLCKWLLYIPKNIVYSDHTESLGLSKNKSFSEASGSLIDTPRRQSTTQLESVHSSSDQHTVAYKVNNERASKVDSIDLQERVYNTLKKWFDVWKGIYLSGDISQCTIYFPMKSLSAVGSQGIQEAVELAMTKESAADILVITLPFANIRSAQRQNILKYLKTLPVTLPENIWTQDKSSFPWTMSVAELSCYTIQHGDKLTFLKPVSLNATVGLSTKPSKTMSATSAEQVQASTEHLIQGVSSKNDILPPDHHRRKGSKATNLSAASSSNAQYGKSNSSSNPNSPASQTKKEVHKKSEKTITSPTKASTTKVDIGYLGVCVHIDTTPIKISTSEIQVYLFASILYGLMEVATNLIPASNSKLNLINKTVPEISPSELMKGSSTISASGIKENIPEDTSDNTPPIIQNKNTIDEDSVKLTAWVQWTITKFTIELLSSEFKEKSVSKPKSKLKLVIDAEDIVSSLDFQSIYLKIKSKIGSASIHHYERLSPDSKWQPGSFSGIVLRLRDDLLSIERREDNSLINVTITRASCQHTHTLWGAIRKKNTDKKTDINPTFLSKTRYITEVVINVQPLDFVISLSTLRSFYLVLIPLMNIPKRTTQITKPENVSNSSFLYSVSNQTLPLAYLDCQDIRVIMPASDFLGNGAAHDAFVFQLQKISLNPQAVNPICRTPIRSDIYDQAAHARILNIPGSEVEDRQYQLDIIGISVCTGKWSEINAVLSPKKDIKSNLRGMSENPALEWNILEQGQPNMTPVLNLKCILDKLDITVILAPSMIYKDNTTICGHAIEVNLASDIYMNLSLHQIKLMSAILSEFVLLVTPLIIQDGILRKPKIQFPYSVERYVHKDSTLESKAKGTSRDSGIDTSDIKSVQSSKAQGMNLLSKQSMDIDKQLIFPRPPNTVPYVYSSIPLEIVLTAGKIALILYSVDDERNSGARYKGRKKKISKKTEEDRGYEASEEESTDDIETNYKKYIPLIFISFTQPNAFFLKQQLLRKFQISCFDVVFKLSGPDYPPVGHNPVEEDFPVSLLETKSGTPSSSTGILPSFFTFRLIKGLSKNTKMELEILKPTKIICQNSRWSHLLSIADKVMDTFKHGGARDSLKALYDAISFSKNTTSVSGRSIKPGDSFSKFQKIRDLMGAKNSISLRFDQLILAVLSESGHEVHLGMRELRSYVSLSTRPEKITFNATFVCLTVTVLNENFRKLLLNPWTISFNVNAFWESWQDSDSDPQVQISAESDNILVDITAEQLKCLEIVTKDFNEFVSTLPSRKKVSINEDSPGLKHAEKDQHYKDDLRAGAFQFIDSNSHNTDEMPLPYQVMFWNKNISAMAWKYPQPRALTKVRVFPVPYKMALATQEHILVLCHLEYWAECRNCYLPYTQFYLSENEICHLALPVGCPKKVVASIWRVVITIVDEETGDPILNKGDISPRALAACMRIDSYFSKGLIPNINFALYISKLELNLYNYFPKNSRSKLPNCLKKFTSDHSFPENQKFLTIALDNVSCYVSSWDFDVLSSEINCSMGSNVLDYAYLTEQTLLDPVSFKLELCLSDGVRCNLISRPMQFKFGPSIAHTLAISSQMWSLKEKNKELDFIVVTRYVVCNDANVCIRFGQDGTDENILLPSRSFHLYSWRSQKKHQKIRLCLEDSDWLWSKAFSISKEGTSMIHFMNERNFTIFVTVKNISNTQKQITFFGQLIVCNMLSEHFEMKVIEAASENREQIFKNAPNHIVGGRCAAPSIFIANKKSYFLRLRFYGLESAWTGDIPLREHATGSQPWLVKVPLQERGQFLSIWCRIYIQDLGKSKRIAAMLWPLFMVKSNLPMSAKVHIETPTLGVHLDTTVNGKGELLQLYCPGTIDHSHQITFQIDGENSNANDPYVPLNYTLVDQREFFKKFTVEDIETVLESLNHCFQSKWPYFDDEYDNVEWIVDDSQPLTHVQVRYQNASPYSCTLMLELLPWCLMVNTLGTAVSVMLNGVELCRVRHHGIMAPPKLDENFHLGVCAGSNWFFSGPLQLGKSDWSQSFYMPRISGNIPLDGTIKTSIKCITHICMMSITSSISNEIRLLRIASTHTLSNHLSAQVHVMCLAVSESKPTFKIPETIERFCFTVIPHGKQSHCGVPIMQWYTVNEEKDSTNIDYALYVTFSFNPKFAWSCPVRIDKPVLRKALVINGSENSVPVILTAQEHKGQIFMALHNDPRPQMFIQNKTNVSFSVGQSLPESSAVATECEHLKWNCKISPFSGTYYTMPLISQKFPELPQMHFSERFALAYEYVDEKPILEWSPGVSIFNDNELFVRVPYYGDVKLTIVNNACTTLISIESVSQVQISARDIRVRLTMREQEEASLTYRDSEEVIKQTSYTDDAARSVASDTLLATSVSEETLEDIEDIPFHRSRSNSYIVPSIYLKEEWNCIEVKIYLNSFGITLITDIEEDQDEKWELANLTCDDLIVVAVQSQKLNVTASFSGLQLDNQLYTKQPFDFPVVLIGQNRKPFVKLNVLSATIEHLLENYESKALVIIELILESWKNDDKKLTGAKSLTLTIEPISCFIEDTYVTRLMQYMKDLNIIDLVLWPKERSLTKVSTGSLAVDIPELVSWQCAILANPLTIKTFVLSPVFMLLSVHSSVKMYIALDESPLHFGKFERRRIFTTSYRLGHALTMHYLSGAIFGAGWVVSSLELLGSPGGLARAMGTGLRDFVSLPYRGFVQGPMAFLKGITTGSASLMKHVTAGTLQSVTKLASSVARNLDRLTLDEEHQKRTEEQRRQRPQGVAQGFLQGMTSFGISLLGAIGGIAHHPLQSMMSQGASPTSLAAGVGVGIVGVITKPLSGAAELVASTGQGLLQGAGWNQLPDLRSQPQIIKLKLAKNSSLKYPWKYIDELYSQILFVTEATTMHASVFHNVALILTTDSFVMVSLESDVIMKGIPLSEISLLKNKEPTILSLKIQVPRKIDKPFEKLDDELAIDMDPEMRARVAEYVKTTGRLLNNTENSSIHSSSSPLSSPGSENRSYENVLHFYVNSQHLKYFTCILNLATQQRHGNHFPVL